MLVDVLRRCSGNVAQLTCCNDRTPCNCEDSLWEDYFRRLDTYNCQKKMNTYVIKYGPSYVSEIYHYLTKSRVLDDFAGTVVNVTSLGCGFAPDYFALQKYNAENQLNIDINYTGLDISTSWNFARPITPNCTFIHHDLTQDFSLRGANIIFVCKSFSTMHRSGIGQRFLTNLNTAINRDLENGAIVVFVDINLQNFGRDVFDRGITGMPYKRQYYFEGLEQQGATYTRPDWIEIESTNIIYPLNHNLIVDSISHTNKTVIFEYRKYN